MDSFATFSAMNAAREAARKAIRDFALAYVNHHGDEVGGCDPDMIYAHVHDDVKKATAALVAEGKVALTADWRLGRVVTAAKP
jgi:hypothetical protein